jgi:hypothetical protein
MREFAEAFLLVFAQTAVGGLCTLVIPPFRQLERGFFKSTAAVYLGLALISVSWWISLFSPERWGAARVTEISIWVTFVAAFAVYFYSLWGDPIRLRSRSFLVALVLGMAAVSATSLRYASGLAPTLLMPLYPIAFLASAFLLGTACSGMLLGHWYLIDLDLTLTPFRRMHRAFTRSIFVQLGVVIGGTTLLFALGGAGTTESLTRLWESHSWLLGLRVLLGPVAAIALAWMIGRTLDVPQTMAATGLFYIALLAVIVGEILGRTILFRTALPL